MFQTMMKNIERVFHMTSQLKAGIFTRRAMVDQACEGRASATRKKLNIFSILKGNLQSKKSLAQMKEREKCKRMSHH